MFSSKRCVFNFEQLISLNAKCLKLIYIKYISNILNIIVPNNLLVFHLGTKKRTPTWCQYKTFCLFFFCFVFRFNLMILDGKQHEEVTPSPFSKLLLSGLFYLDFNGWVNSPILAN